MSKFIVDVIYEGSIAVTVEAENEDDACDKAIETTLRMDEEQFLHNLNPYWTETNIIEKIIE